MCDINESATFTRDSGLKASKPNNGKINHLRTGKFDPVLRNLVNGKTKVELDYDGSRTSEDTENATNGGETGVKVVGLQMAPKIPCYAYPEQEPQGLKKPKSKKTIAAVVYFQNHIPDSPDLNLSTNL